MEKTGKGSFFGSSPAGSPILAVSYYFGAILYLIQPNQTQRTLSLIFQFLAKKMVGIVLFSQHTLKETTACLVLFAIKQRVIGKMYICMYKSYLWCLIYFCVVVDCMIFFNFKLHRNKDRSIKDKSNSSHNQKSIN